MGFKIGHPKYIDKGEFKKGNIPWNKELTKETDKRVRNSGLKISKANKGQKLEKIHKLNCSCCICKAIRGENKGKKRPEMAGINNPWFGKFAERAPNWQNGKSFEPYPLGWNKTFKEQIRFRDGYKCQLCGVPEAECKEKLHVHHIDYNKQNINQENLVSLCTNCHVKTNGNRKYWEQYFIKIIVFIKNE